MRSKTFKGLILSLFFILIFSNVTFADEMNMGNVIEKNVNGITVQLSFKNEKPKTGKDQIMITLKDSKGKEIDNGEVNVIAEMPNDDSMKMDSNEPIKLNLKNNGSGQYMSDIKFTNKGQWTVTADITIDGVKNSADFNVDVINGGPNWFVIGGFVGIVAIIIIVAVVKKNKAK
ncbi:FixH family protein [Clostridium sp. 19966]|uniref:FixH family protein n=1 Tax=Clostridium sp. 19966 TaxID=2768166 RepID=UPI0028DFCF7B|nr:FixH family protein [Clostridium sp. 19966]MDT8718621.1 FixH family protein [Clostridium sp. 19966]